jgi:spore coat protein U-like protein
VTRAAALAVVVLLVPAMARAATCTVSATPVAFGVYPPFSGAPTTSTGTTTVHCVAGAANVVIALSTGGGGSYANRRMISGASNLTYQLYSDAARTMIWGDGTAGTVTVSVHVANNGTKNNTVYGRIAPLQGVRPGAYTDTITVTVTY